MAAPKKATKAAAASAAKPRTQRAAPTAAASPIPSLPVLMLVGVGSSAMSMLAAAVLIVAAIKFGVVGPLGPTPGPDPVPTVDPAFVAIGEAYGPALVKTYSAAWANMADRVDAGQPIGESVAAFQADWLARRNDLFNARLVGPFKALVPEGASESDITASQRAAYAAAARGVAEGLSK